MQKKEGRKGELVACQEGNVMVEGGRNGRDKCDQR